MKKFNLQNPQKKQLCDMCLENSSKKTALSGKLLNAVCENFLQKARGGRTMQKPGMLIASESSSDVNICRQ